MSSVSTAVMTAEEFFEWANRPENSDTRYELEDGKVVPMPSPGELRGTICWLLTHLLSTYVFRRGAGQICTNDTGLVVRRGPDSVRGPDVVLFLESRAVGQLNHGHIDRVPAIVAEVLSPIASARPCGGWISTSPAGCRWCGWSIRTNWRFTSSDPENSDTASNRWTT